MQGEIEKIQRKKQRNNKEKPRKPRVEDKCERQIHRQREMESGKRCVNKHINTKVEKMINLN
jgi:hypothetical protein